VSVLSLLAATTVVLSLEGVAERGEDDEQEGQPAQDREAGEEEAEATMSMMLPLFLPLLQYSTNKLTDDEREKNGQRQLREDRRGRHRCRDASLHEEEGIYNWINNCCFATCYQFEEEQGRDKYS
jgi:hypothetical protein